VTSASTPQERILDAAARVFAKHGVHDSSVEDVLQLADVSRRTFYRHFRNKDDVLSALYELAMSELFAAMDSVRTKTNDPFAALRYGLDAYLDFHTAGRTLLRVLLVEAFRSGSPLVERRRLLREAVAERLREAAEAVTKTTADPYVYYALMSALEGLSLELVTSDATPASVARAKAVMVALLERTFALEHASPLPPAPTTQGETDGPPPKRARAPSARPPRVTR
jgi:AcrR family transcriptional regulator